MCKTFVINEATCGGCGTPIKSGKCRCRRQVPDPSLIGPDGVPNTVRQSGGGNSAGRGKYLGAAVGPMATNSDPKPHEQLRLPVWNYDASEAEDDEPVLIANDGGTDCLGLPVWNFDVQQPQKPARRRVTANRDLPAPLGLPVWDW